MRAAKIRIIAKRLGMSGQDLVFEKEDFFGLKPGQYVSQIGNGKENGTIRTDNFDTPIKYVGSIVCQFETPEKMYSFQLSEKVGEENIYLLYGSTGGEIFTEAVMSMRDRTTKKHTGYMRFYAPQFVISD